MIMQINNNTPEFMGIEEYLQIGLDKFAQEHGYTGGEAMRTSENQSHLSLFFKEETELTGDRKSVV